MEIPVILVAGEDGWVIAECPALPGCLSQGRTEEEALTNIKNAIRSWLRVEADKRGQPPGGKLVEVAL